MSKSIKGLIFVVAIVMVTVILSGCTTAQSPILSNNTNAWDHLPVADNSGQDTVSVPIIESTNTGNQTNIINPQTEGSYSLIINSVEKLTSLNNLTPRPGNVFLVLNITIKSNEPQEKLVFTDKSISLVNTESHEKIDSSLNSNPKIQKEISHLISSPTTIYQKDTISGMIVFGVRDSTGYRVNLIDGGKQVLSSQKINFDNLITSPSPIILTIDSAKTVPYLNNESRPSSGHVFLVLNITVKNNDMPEGFVFTNRSITATNIQTNYFVDFTLNSRPAIQRGLDDPIIAPIIIQQNNAISGQILFGITPSADYRLELLDGNKTTILYKNIHID